MFNLKVLALLCLITLVVFYVEARPSTNSVINCTKNKDSTCCVNETNLDTCQKCAKMTKSPVVYPMCCNNEDGVYSWCERYIDYGIH